MADLIKSKEKIMEKQKIEKTVKNEELLPNILYEITYEEGELDYKPEKPEKEPACGFLGIRHDYVYHYNRAFKVVADTKEDALRILKKEYDQETKHIEYRFKITEEIIKLTLERAILEDFYYDDILNQYEYFSELSCLECNGKFVATIKFVQK